MEYSCTASFLTFLCKTINELGRTKVTLFLRRKKCIDCSARRSTLMSFFSFFVVEDSTPPEKKTVKNEYGDGLIDEEEPGIKRSSSIGAAAKKLPGGGMGFGNLINQNILAGKKLKKVHQDDRKETKSKTEEASAPTSEPPSKSSFGKTKAPMVGFLFV